MSNNPVISLKDIDVSFDGEVILDKLNLDIENEEFITLLGPSGCGKTTTLRIIGGFLQPDSGEVYFDGEKLTTFRRTSEMSIQFSRNMRCFPI